MKKEDSRDRGRGGVFVHRAQWRVVIWTGLPAKSKNGEPAFLFWDSKGEE